MTIRQRRVREEGRVGGSYEPVSNRPSGPPLKQRIIQTVRFTTVLLGLLAALVGLVWLLLSYSVRTVHVTGAPSATVEEATRRHLEGGLLGDNLITLNTSNLSSQLMTDLRQTAAAVTIHKQWRQRALTVVIEPRQPAINWLTRGHAFQLDKEGIAMSRVRLARKLPTVRDESNLPVEVVQQVAPAQFVSFITTVIPQLKNKTKLSVTGLRVRDTTAELLIDTNQGFYIRCDTTASVEEQVASVKTVLKQSRGAIGEYIDVRLAHKAYYR